MLKHLKMKASLKGYEKQLNRTFLIQENIDLNLFANIVLASFGVEFCHYWEVYVDRRHFYPADFLEEDGIGEAAIDYTLYDFDLTRGRTLTLTYDFGENYQFTIRVLKEDVDFPLAVPYVFLEANGDTIFEDNRCLLEYFLDNGSFPDDVIPYDLPEDYSLEDFNQPLDVQMINDYVLYRVAEVVYGIEFDEEDDDDDEQQGYYHQHIFS